MHWQTSRFLLDLSQPRVMGIVNLTPDSFSDGGRLQAERQAALHMEQLLCEGADVLDLGAESSRPGAPRVSAELEWQRLEPALRLALGFGVPVSVDTCKPEVMERALALGADAINDIQALQAPGALELMARYPQAGFCLMHMRGEPAQMQQLTQYGEVGPEVCDWLLRRLQACLQAGLRAEQFLLDPGFGFAKSAAQNFELQQHLGLHPLPRPWLAGWSRKSSLGWVTGAALSDRLPASLAAALAAVEAGARMLRVHDVAATTQALRIWQALHSHG